MATRLMWPDFCGLLVAGLTGFHCLCWLFSFLQWTKLAQGKRKGLILKLIKLFFIDILEKKEA